ncbi:MAG: hypothetical protein CMO01_13305 [Thalassobius sp.]|nr:hypothetical protein [Thalassovita sp.]
MDSTCLLYIADFSSQDELVMFVNEKFEGNLINETLYLKNHNIEIDFDENEDFDLRKSSNQYDGFLYFPYKLWINFNDSFTTENFIQFVNVFLKYFDNSKKKVVAACDYEEKLIHNGDIRPNSL